MALLSKAQLLATKLPTKDVAVPELGGTVRVQQMSLLARTTWLEVIRLHNRKVNDFEKDQEKPASKRQNLPDPGELDHVAMAVCFCVVDEEGNRLFDPEDTSELHGLSHTALLRLWRAVEEINKFRDDVNVAVESEKKD